MGLFGSFLSKFSRNKASIEDIEEFRTILIESDLGAATADEIVELVKKEKSENLESAVQSRIKSYLTSESRDLNIQSGSLTTILIVGVNGTGKTTSAAKLANLLKDEGKKVLLGAADTFRAAAVDQLTIWSERVGVPIVKQNMGADPSAVAFDTVQSAISKNADVVLIDTAGRLHNKAHLMDELNKIKRVIQKQVPDAPHEVLLVLDGSTGQNALEQAKQFMAVTDVNALAITKLDGTAKGGVVLAIAHQCKIPDKYISVGEQIKDLLLFDKDAFVDSLFNLNK